MLSKVYSWKEKGLLLAFISTAVGGISTVTFKQLMTTMTYHEIALCEAFFLTFLFGVLKGWSLEGLGKREIACLFIGSLANAAGYLFFFLALCCLNPLELSFLGRNQVTLSILFGTFLLGERHPWYQWFAIFLMLGGALCFTYVPGVTHSLEGVFYASCFCTAMAARSLLIKLSKPIHTNVLMFWASLFCLIAVLISGGLSEEESKQLHQLIFSQSFLIIAASSFVANALGVSLFFRALQVGELSTVSAIRSLSPLFVALYTFPFVEYVWTPLKLVGLFSCLFSIAVFLVPLWAGAHMARFVKAKAEG